MVDYRSPEAIAKSMHAYIICVNLIAGAGVWEWLTSLDFDLLYLRRKNRLGLAATSYFLVRYLGLALWVTSAAAANAYTPHNCRVRDPSPCLAASSGIFKALNYAINVVSYGTAGFTSLLLLLRVSAVSSRNIYIMSFLWTVYAAAGATAVIGMCVGNGANSMQVPEFNACAITTIKYYRLNSIMAAGFDGICLIAMMYFLLRDPVSIIDGSIWELMLRQGAVYVLCISLVYIPVIVFLHVDLNKFISQTINNLAFFAMHVSATRMHRALVTFYETPSGKHTEISQQVSDRSIMFTRPGVRASRRRDMASVTVTVGTLGETTTEGTCHAMEKLETGTLAASVAPAYIADLHASDLR